MQSCSAAGAFGSLWLLDLRRAEHESFTTEHESYGWNVFTMIASRPSQYWYEIYAAYFEESDAIDDPSDIYVRQYRGKRALLFIGYASFILVMAKLLAMFAKGLVPGHEMVIDA